MLKNGFDREEEDSEVGDTKMKLNVDGAKYVYCGAHLK
jgi:hypothetical protein